MKITQFFIIGILTLPALARAGDLMDTGIDKCVNAYYGIGEKADYGKAYKCFDAKKIWPYMIIMQLNGQGVPVNPGKAKQLMDKWDKADPYNIKTLDHTQLREIVTKRIQDRTPSEKNVDFCNDVAGTTYSMDFCAEINDRLEKQATEDAMDSIRTGLNASQKMLWDRIQTAAAVYEKADAERIYQKFADGTIRGMAYEGQKSFVRDNFIKQMQLIFSSKKISSIKQEDLRTLDSDMRNTYQKDIDSYSQDHDSKSDSADDKDMKEQDKTDVAEFSKDAKAAQQAWANLTNLIIKLTQELHPDNSTVWTSKAMLAMMRARITDLKNNPVCSDGC